MWGRGAASRCVGRGGGADRKRLGEKRHAREAGKYGTSRPAGQPTNRRSRASSLGETAGWNAREANIRRRPLELKAPLGGRGDGGGGWSGSEENRSRGGRRGRGRDPGMGESGGGWEEGALGEISEARFGLLHGSLSCRSRGRGETAGSGSGRPLLSARPTLQGCFSQQGRSALRVAGVKKNFGFHERNGKGGGVIFPLNAPRRAESPAGVGGVSRQEGFLLPYVILAGARRAVVLCTVGRGS